MSRKSGPPAHQNTERWVPARADKHNNLKKIVEAEYRGGVCQRCRDIIEWKKAYGKYKPLKTPGKCTHCNQRVVTLAYHAMCLDCARAKHVCAKCGDAAPMRQASEDDRPRPPDPDALAMMSERQRRTAIRKYEKAERDRKEAAKAALEVSLGSPPDANVSIIDEQLADATAPLDVPQCEDIAQSACASLRSAKAATSTSVMSAEGLPSSLARPNQEHADDDAAVAAVEAEAATEEDSDGEADDEVAESCSDRSSEAACDENDMASLCEQLASLSHSAGAAALVRQAYPHVSAEGTNKIISLLAGTVVCSTPNTLTHVHVRMFLPSDRSTAEEGFDSLIERLTSAGGARAKQVKRNCSLALIILPRYSLLLYLNVMSLILLCRRMI